jgi:hypothetical protein
MSPVVRDNLSSAQRRLLRQVCQNKNACGPDTATRLSPLEARSASYLESLELITISPEGARPTGKALISFSQWNPDQLELFSIFPS